MRIRSKTLKALVPQLRLNGFRARRETGKSLTAQAAEMLSLAWGVGKLHPKEYYQYRLYDDRRYEPNDKKSFLGSVCQDELFYAFGSDGWRVLAWDKVIWAELLDRLGLPVPMTLAVYHLSRTAGVLPCCATVISWRHSFGLRRRIHFSSSRSGVFSVKG